MQLVTGGASGDWCTIGAGTALDLALILYGVRAEEFLIMGVGGVWCGVCVCVCVSYPALGPDN
jgi:hypothetical protein